MSQYQKINKDISLTNAYIYYLGKVSDKVDALDIVKQQFEKDLNRLLVKKDEMTQYLISEKQNIIAKIKNNKKFYQMILQFIKDIAKPVNNMTIYFVEKLLTEFNEIIGIYKYNAFHDKKNIKLDEFKYLKDLVNIIVFICNDTKLENELDKSNNEFEEALVMEPNQKEIYDRYFELELIINCSSIIPFTFIGEYSSLQRFIYS